MPWAKGRIGQSWKLFRLWRKLEIPCRAPPLTAELVFSFAAMAIHRGDLTFAGLLLLGFEGLLRTGELPHLRGSDILIRDGIGLVRLDETKTSFNKGAEEFVPLQHPWVLMVVETLLAARTEQHVLSDLLWTGTPASFRLRFKEFCRLFHVTHLGFRPYSLRRGGATDLFQRSFSYDLALDRGRWHSIRAAKLYIQDGLARLPALAMSDQAKSMIVKWFPL